MLSSGFASLNTSSATSSGVWNGVPIITTYPISSIPRLPARPDICRNSLGVRVRCPVSVRLLIELITVERAGMLIPAARVSVAKTTFINPFWNNFSTRTFHPGRSPAWCDATPRSRYSMCLFLYKYGFSAMYSSIIFLISSCSSLVTRQSDAQFSICSSHFFLEKVK